MDAVCPSPEKSGQCLVYFTDPVRAMFADPNRVARPSHAGTSLLSASADDPRWQSLTSIAERCPRLDGNTRRVAATRDYFINDDQHLHFLNDNMEPLLTRHPLNGRGDEAVTESWAVSADQDGFVEGARGVAITAPSKHSKLEGSYLLVGAAAFTQGVYRAAGSSRRVGLRQ